MGDTAPNPPAPDAPLWQATLLRRAAGARAASVAGRAEFHAPDIDAARAAAELELSRRADGDEGWTIGLLRPLTPRAPGTYLYEIVFALWTSVGDRMERRDVAHLHAWAQDAATARRIAQQDIQENASYLPAWRIRRVSRVPEASTGPL